jgi:hypothetical protein
MTQKRRGYTAMWTRPLSRPGVHIRHRFRSAVVVAMAEHPRPARRGIAAIAHTFLGLVPLDGLCVAAPIDAVAKPPSVRATRVDATVTMSAFAGPAHRASPFLVAVICRRSHTARRATAFNCSARRRGHSDRRNPLSGLNHTSYGNRATSANHPNRTSMFPLRSRGLKFDSSPFGDHAPGRGALDSAISSATLAVAHFVNH